VEDKKIMAQRPGMLWEINKFSDPSSYESRQPWLSTRQTAVKPFDTP